MSPTPRVRCGSCGDDGVIVVIVVIVVSASEDPSQRPGLGEDHEYLRNDPGEEQEQRVLARDRPDQGSAATTATDASWIAFEMKSERPCTPA